LLDGISWLIVELLYGSRFAGHGICPLWIKDVNFQMKQEICLLLCDSCAHYLLQCSGSIPYGAGFVGNSGVAAVIFCTHLFNKVGKVR